MGMFSGGIDLAPLRTRIVVDMNDFRRSMRDAGREGERATDDISDGFDDASRSAEDSGGRIKKAFGGIAKMVVGAFAVGKIVEFGKATVNAAATAQAVNAQFSQTFGDLEKEAQKSVEGLGKKFGMVPERIKPAFAQTTAMFKGLGLDTEKAMEQAEKATTLAADGAAFYDKSMEDAQSSLNSFIKGNYEGKSFAPCYRNVA